MATTTHITLVIHHRGRLERGSDGKLCYAEGEITEVERVNVDTLNGFFISDLLKDIGYPIISDFYWRQPGMEIEGGLRLLRLDMDVVKMYEAAVENGHKIDIYTEHPISQEHVADTNEEAGVEAPGEVNVTPSRKRRKVCARRTPTPKKAKGPRRILQLEGVQTEAEITVEPHGTEKGQVDGSPNPSLPATPKIVPVSEESATPNTVPATSIPLDHENLGDTAPPSTSDDPQDELLTQYVPLPQNQPSSQSMPEPHPTPPTSTPSTNPSATVNAPETQNNNSEEGTGGSRRKQIRRSTKRPLPTGQTFIPNTDPNQPPSVFIPVDGGDYSDDEPGVHCYESEGLHSIGSDDDDQGRSFPQGNADAPVKEVRLELEMEFETLQQFKKAVRKFNINLGRSIFFPRIDSIRCKAICYDENCPWQIYCAKRSYPVSYQVKTFVNEHTCPRNLHCKSANGKWVVDELEDRIRNQPDMTVKDAENYFRTEFDVLVNERKLYRSMATARERIEGSEAAQYLRLRDYSNEILKTNPGSTVRIHTSPMPGLESFLFKRIYVCLNACKRGFIEGCRPFIGLDGTFLRGYYGDQLLTAIGADANNHIFPIAYAIVESENKDSWKWFLELLQDDVGDHAANGFNLMSDMQKGLIPAVKDIMPGAHHRFCAMHIYQNFRKQWPDLEMKAAMWACTKATTPQEFEVAMGRVKRINQHAWEYLNKIPPQQWSRSHFSEYPKVDFYTNNNCETFNGKIKKMRGKPIITMLEEVRGYVMRILARNKKALVGYNGRITPVQQSRLEREKKESNYWRPFPSGDEHGNVYEVQRLPVKVSVDLGRRTCSCRLWQLTGLPCRHAYAAIAYQNRRAEDFAHNWLTMGAYNLAYQWTVQPVPSQEYWEKGNHYPLLPPVYRKPIGRPTKKRDTRRDGPTENPDPHRAKRRYGPIKCKYCLKTGHNSRGCDKKKEAMASGGAAPGSSGHHQGEEAASEHMAAADLDEDAARHQEMYWEETLEAADAEASASDSPSVNVDDRNCVDPNKEPMAVRPPPTNSSTAYVPPRPIIHPTMSKRPVKRRNVKRPPPSQPSPLRPDPPQPTPTTPATPQTSVVRPTAPPNQPHPKVTTQTMHGASRGTTTRFMRFMPTPPSTSQTAGRWPAPGFRPPTGASSSGNNNGVSSGSSNSTPNK